ncbi:AraC family transcriptional regulator [Paenibacillus hodogayensis]|uniref:AraC family transcriptional regulator n=1 Tax=Paenibacillus hodogayensis TaxID=279208 RepID=A0ABV5VWU5_9BACL
MYLRKIETVDLPAVVGKETGGGIHPYHEILFISEGTVLLQWINRDYVASAPALFLLSPNTPHTLIRKSAFCRFGFIELDMEGSTEFPNLAQARLWNGMQSDKDPLGAGIASIYEMAFQIWNNLNPLNPYKSIAMDLIPLDIRKLLLLVSCFLNAREPRLADPSRVPAFPDKADATERIHKVIRYMESNYQNPLTITLLASHVYLDVSYFIRSFHKIVGKTPLQYLHELRLNAAISFLSTTKMSIQDITNEIGFQSIHYFSRLFKQKYGVSPSLWRTRHIS